MMAGKPTPRYDIRHMIDATPDSVVIMCPCCKWRDIKDSRGAAWYALARHLSSAHDEVYLSSKAWKCVRRAGYNHP